MIQFQNNRQNKIYHKKTDNMFTGGTNAIDKKIDSMSNKFEDLIQDYAGKGSKQQEDTGMNQLFSQVEKKSVQNDVSNDTDANGRIKAQFANRFKQLANSPEAFHQLLQKVYGPGMDRSKAETLRQKAQQGDFGWLPKIEVKSKEVMKNGRGAYDAERDVVYLNESIMNDPDQAMAVYAEEVGHAMDKKFKKGDTQGDEGEMFRRLFMGEDLSRSEMERIRNEDDSGVLNIDGRDVEVEFSLLSDAVRGVGRSIRKGIKSAGKAISRGVKSVGNAISKGVKKIGQGISKLASGVGNVFKKVVNSKIFQAILTVAQFIPPLAPFAKIGQIVSAGFQVANGIKNGNFMQAAMGVIGGATGLGKSTGMLGLSSKFTNVMNKVSSYGQFGLSAYHAVKTGNIENLALTMISKVAPNAPMGHIKEAANIYQKAKAIKNSLEQGDELAALNNFTSLAGNYVNDGSKLDKTLDTINKIGGDVQAVQRAIKEENYTQLPDLLMNDVKKYTGLQDEDLNNVYNTLRMATSAVNVDKQLKAGDWIGAGLGVAEAGHHLSENEVVRGALAEVSRDIYQTKEVFDALKNHQYDNALEKLNKMLGNPIPKEQFPAPVNMVQQNIKAIEKSINAKDYDRAAAQIAESVGSWMPLKEGAVEEIRSTLDLAETVADIVDKVKNEDLTGIRAELISQGAIATKSTMNTDFGQNLELLQSLRTDLAQEHYDGAITRANQLLGKSWSAEQWMQELNDSNQALDGVGRAVDNKDWPQAAKRTMEALSKYVNISEDTGTDVHRLVKLLSAFEKRFV